MTGPELLVVWRFAELTYVHAPHDSDRDAAWAWMRAHDREYADALVEARLKEA